MEEKVKKDGDIEGGGEEMDLCDTPPHLSPSEAEKLTGKFGKIFFKSKKIFSGQLKIFFLVIF